MEKIINTDISPTTLLRGPVQLVFAIKHGLLPEHYFLEIGCSKLFCGQNFIIYLDRDRYMAVDVENIERNRLYVKQHEVLRSKNPKLLLLSKPISINPESLITFDHIDMAIGFNIFTHNPLSTLVNWINYLSNKTSQMFINLNIAEDSGNENGTLFWVTEKEFYKYVEGICCLERLEPLPGTKNNEAWKYNLHLTQWVYKITW
uniref:Putative methyltransferase n=1 Tax=viral metagenome TaxID=1070528 RepID=A0A6M3LEZ5_9ZZZZ